MTTSSYKGGREGLPPGCRGRICKEELGSSWEVGSQQSLLQEDFHRLHEEVG